MVRYVGPLHIATGDWVGLELPDDSGKNDGSVKGERYFTCKTAHGIFVRKETVDKIIKQAAAVTPRSNGASTPQNSSVVRPRPSNIAPADAKKRQSIMSAAARQSTTGSRLSMIVSR